MSFYGKVFAQMDDVFDSFYFDNVEKNASLYTGKLQDDFILGAESFNDKFIMKAGNSWIQFVKIANPIKGESGDAVEIYHGPPMAGKDYAGEAKKSITTIKAGSLYNRLVSDSSILLSQKEKDTLKGYRSEGKLIFFGDTITISSPLFDKAGHITGYDSTDYIVSEVPRLEEFLDMANDIIELQEVVGTTGYPDGSSEGTISYRLYAIEQEIEAIADNAEAALEAAKKAAEAAEQAASSAESAAESAANAQELAQRVYDGYNTNLTAIDAKYASLVSALGVSDASQIRNERQDIENILQWLIDLEARIIALEK